MPIPFKNYVDINDPSGEGPPVLFGSSWTITDGTNIVTEVQTLTVSGNGTIGGSEGQATLDIGGGGGGSDWNLIYSEETFSNVANLSVAGSATVTGSAGNYTLTVLSAGSILTVTDGTTSEDHVTFIGIVGGAVSSGSSGHVTLTIPESELLITDGTHEVANLTNLEIIGGVVSGTAGNGTLTVLPTGGTNGQVLQLVAGTPTWVSPPQDFSAYSAVLQASQVCLAIKAERVLTFAANKLNVTLDVATTSDAIFMVNKNGSAIGSITVLASTSLGTSTVPAFTTAALDDIRILAPGVVDATAAGCMAYGTCTR